LLDRGSPVVIASPWPLDARVPYHWLPEFLSAWIQGNPVIEANFTATTRPTVWQCRCMEIHCAHD
jgi:hypothetical protein